MKIKQILPIDLYLEYKKGRKERETEIIEIIDKWYEDDEEISYYQYEDLIKKIKEIKEQ